MCRTADERRYYKCRVSGRPGAHYNIYKSIPEVGPAAKTARIFNIKCVKLAGLGHKKGTNQNRNYSQPARTRGWFTVYTRCVYCYSIFWRHTIARVCGRRTEDVFILSKNRTMTHWRVRKRIVQHGLSEIILISYILYIRSARPAIYSKKDKKNNCGYFLRQNYNYNRYYNHIFATKPINGFPTTRPRSLLPKTYKYIILLYVPLEHGENFFHSLFLNYIHVIYDGLKKKSNQNNPTAVLIVRH